MCACTYYISRAISYCTFNVYSITPGVRAENRSSVDYIILCFKCMHRAKSLDRLSLNFSPYCTPKQLLHSSPSSISLCEWNFSPFNRMEDEMRDSASRQLDWDYKKHIMCTLERYKNVFFSFFFFSCGFHCQNREKISVRRNGARLERPTHPHSQFFAFLSVLCGFDNYLFKWSGYLRTLKVTFSRSHASFAAATTSKLSTWFDHVFFPGCHSEP